MRWQRDFTLNGLWHQNPRCSHVNLDLTRIQKCSRFSSIVHCWGDSPAADKAMSTKQTKQITTCSATSKFRVHNKTVNTGVPQVPCSNALSIVCKLITTVQRWLLITVSRYHSQTLAALFEYHQSTFSVSSLSPWRRTLWLCGLRLLACWDCGFESRWGHECSCLFFCMCRLITHSEGGGVTNCVTWIPQQLGGLRR